MSSDGELNWLATQYVLDELSESERDAFEERLVTDLAACEAVAAASQLLATVKAAVSSPAVVVTVAPQVSKKPLWPALLTSVATLSLVSTAFWFSMSEPGGSDLSMSNLDDDSMVSEVDETDDDEQLTIPEWLIAGVSLEDDDDSKDN